jgi:hypothetical protein
MIKSYFILFTLFAVAVLSLSGVNCSMSPVANGGNTSETTNGVVLTGIILQPGNIPAQGALVQIHSSSFLADTSFIHLNKTALVQYTNVNVYTDSNGIYVADSLDTGKAYSVQATLNDDAVIFECQVTGGVDTVHVAPQTLVGTGSIAGDLAFSGVVPCRVYIRIYGTDIGTVVDPPSTHFAITGLAPGSYCIKMYPSILGYDDEDRCGIIVLPDSSTNIGTFTIKYDY